MRQHCFRDALTEERQTDCGGLARRKGEVVPASRVVLLLLGFALFPSEARAAEGGKPPARAEVGAFVGGAYRGSDSSNFSYGVGPSFGAYVRPQLTSWLSARVSYRQEYLPVELARGALDWGGKRFNFDFTQPDLDLIGFGFAFEPEWRPLPRLRLHGIAGLSWMRIVAGAPRAPGFQLDGSRTSNLVAFEWGVGAGYDLIENWLHGSAIFRYGATVEQHGSAYEPLQFLLDGKIAYLAPLAQVPASFDFSIQLGVLF